MIPDPSSDTKKGNHRINSFNIRDDYYYYYYSNGCPVFIIISCRYTSNTLLLSYVMGENSIAHNQFTKFLGEKSWSGLLIKSKIISVVGQYPTYTFPFSIWSIINKYCMLIAQVLFLKLFFRFLPIKLFSCCLDREYSYCRWSLMFL